MSTAPPDSFPGHDGGAWAPVPSRIVASWPEGHFAENLAVDDSGAVFVTLHSHNRIMRCDPAQAGTAGRSLAAAEPGGLTRTARHDG